MRPLSLSKNFLCNNWIYEEKSVNSIRKYEVCIRGSEKKQAPSTSYFFVSRGIVGRFHEKHQHGKIKSLQRLFLGWGRWSLFSSRGAPTGYHQGNLIYRAWRPTFGYTKIRPPASIVDKNRLMTGFKLWCRDMLKRLCLSLRFVISFGCHSIKMGGGGKVG